MSRCAAALWLWWAACSSQPAAERADGASGKDGGQAQGNSQGAAGSQAAAGSRATSSGTRDAAAGDDEPPNATKDAGLPPRTQGDAPAGYCPGATVRESDRPCWDGKQGFCFRCYGPLEPVGNCTGTMTLPPAPVPTCTSDGDCARFGTRCNPGHPLANEQGCTGPSCADGAACPAGTLCDPSSPAADPALLRGTPGTVAVTGCRLLSCSDPGGRSCGALECAPGAAGANMFGCKPRSCSPSAACPTGQTCASGTCADLPCFEPDGVECPSGWRCDAGKGCVLIPCNQPGGVACPSGMACDATSASCRKLSCNEPGATPCAGGERCVEVRPGQPNGFECIECMRNEDCGCGSCVERKCYTRPGFCHAGCA